MNSHTKNTKKYLLVSVLCLLLILALLFVFTNKPEEETSRTDTSTEPRTNSDEPTAQENFSDGNNREPGNALREGAGSGVVEDNEGTIDSQGDESSWIVSNTGEITVYTPIENNLLETGDSISGESSLSNVSFRLIDNISGVIAEGELTVKNGRFSGKFTFNTTATEGRLDVFARSNDGTEFSNIEVPIRFNQ